MSVALCTDSSALFPAGVAEQLGVTTVPVAIALNGEVYGAGDLDTFYERLSSGARATTSQPSPGDFLAAYEAAAACGAEEVLSIHLDARVSGTLASASLAAEDASIPVTIVDAGTASFGVGLCVRAAAKALAAGASAPSAAAVARQLGPKAQNVFVARGGAGGRVQNESGWAVLEFVDGETRLLTGCETVDGAVGIMAEQVLQVEGAVRAAVGHAARGVQAEADALAALLDGSAQVADVERYRVGAAVGAHTGPLSFGAFWWPAE